MILHVVASGHLLRGVQSSKLIYGQGLGTVGLCYRDITTPELFNLICPTKPEPLWLKLHRHDGSLIPSTHTLLVPYSYRTIPPRLCCRRFETSTRS